MKRCPNCANWIEEQAAFCSHCGARVTTYQGTTWSHLPEDDPERTQPMRRQGPAYNPARSDPGERPFTGSPDYGQIPPPPPPPSRGKMNSPNTFRLLIAGLVLMFICAAVLAVLTLFSAIAGGTSRLVTQVEDFVTDPLEAAGFAPTDTPIPPTPTPWPTLTPLPNTNDGDQGGDTGGGLDGDSEPAFLSPACSAALDHLQRVSDAFNQSPTSVFQTEWRSDARQALDEMQAACGSLESASPVPGQVEEVRRLLSLTSDTYDEANRLLKEGIDERSPGKVWDAVQLYPQAINYLNQTIQGLRAIGR